VILAARLALQLLRLIAEMIAEPVEMLETNALLIAVQMAQELTLLEAALTKTTI
jgi:hypothetical protein